MTTREDSRKKTIAYSQLMSILLVRASLRTSRQSISLLPPLHPHSLRFFSSNRTKESGAALTKSPAAESSAKPSKADNPESSTTAKLKSKPESAKALEAAAKREAKLESKAKAESKESESLKESRVESKAQVGASTMKPESKGLESSKDSRLESLSKLKAARSQAETPLEVKSKVKSPNSSKTAKDEASLESKSNVESGAVAPDPVETSDRLSESSSEPPSPTQVATAQFFKLHQDLAACVTVEALADLVLRENSNDKWDEVNLNEAILAFKRFRLEPLQKELNCLEKIGRVMVRLNQEYENIPVDFPPTTSASSGEFDEENPYEFMKRIDECQLLEDLSNIVVKRSDEACDRTIVEKIIFKFRLLRGDPMQKRIQECGKKLERIAEESEIKLQQAVEEHHYQQQPRISLESIENSAKWMVPGGERGGGNRATSGLISTTLPSLVASPAVRIPYAAAPQPAAAPPPVTQDRLRISKFFELSRQITGITTSKELCDLVLSNPNRLLDPVNCANAMKKFVKIHPDKFSLDQRQLDCVTRMASIKAKYKP